MSLGTAVQDLIDVACALRDATDDALSRALVNRGHSADLAERLVAFVPMALARVILARGGVVLPAAYEIRESASGRSWRGQLADEPVFVAAEQFANERGHSDPK